VEKRTATSRIGQNQTNIAEEAGEGTDAGLPSLTGLLLRWLPQKLSEDKNNPPLEAGNNQHTSPIKKRG